MKADSVEALFNLDPLQLQDQDIFKGVEALRRMRSEFLAAGGETGAKTPGKPAAKAPKKTLSKEELGTLNLDSLGIKIV